MSMNEQKLTSKHYKKMFDSMPTVSMSIFSWFKNTENMKYETE